jgi:feruloyl-CoA synthase
MTEVLTSPAVLAHFQKIINALAQTSTGSATRIARALLLATPPSIDLGEITDKGSINQRMVLKHRDDLVLALHAGTAPHILQPQA